MLILTCLLLLLGAQDPPPAAQGDEATLLEEARHESALEIEKSTAAIPRGQPVRLEELLEPRFVNGFLLVDLAVEPDRPRILYPIENAPGTTVEVRSRTGEAEFPFFSIIVRRIGDSGTEVLVYADMFAGKLEGQLTMSMQRATLEDGLVQVTLAQLIHGLEDHPAVRLSINRSPPGEDGATAHRLIESQTFIDLSREHPEIFARYVRPMLAELGLQDAIDPEFRAAAVQLFLAELPVDDDTRTRVTDLLEELDAPQFVRRQEAQRQLEEIGRPAATALLQLARERQLSPEQATRVQSVVGRYRPLDPEEIARRGEDRDFLQEVASLTGKPDDEHLAELARRRLAGMEASPAQDRPSAVD